MPHTRSYDKAGKDTFLEITSRQSGNLKKLILKFGWMMLTMSEPVHLLVHLTLKKYLSRLIFY